MKRFSDLQFVEFLDGVSARVTYGDYELSVVNTLGHMVADRVCTRLQYLKVIKW